ncbi:hypothetical protein [Streptomyces smaragdinus]|uniref:hypothetical protein n=1 Tax=Streptomyces smaragdinus TaxID=2585196 RepID=UPI0012972392|nr:hypothetical protein [Streptomyces smaragdinus]
MDEVLGRSVLARAVARSRLRLDGADAVAWAALVLAEVDPSVLGRPSGGAVVGEVARRLGAPSGRVGDVGSVGGSERPGSPVPVSTTPADAPRAPEPKDDTATPNPRGLPTRWAGLLFLLALAPAVGLPHAVLATPALAGRSLPWVLQGVALTLVPAAGDDPALAAFAGLDPLEPSPLRVAPPASPDERCAVGELAGRWARAAAEALGRPPEAGPVTVRALAARRGEIVFDPGWIEAVLPLDEVDVDVRVAGLDLDPGWVWWLGCVVRYRYV